MKSKEAMQRKPNPLTMLCASLGLALAALGGEAQVPAAPVSPAPVVTYEYDAQGNPTRTIQAPNVGGLDLKTVKRPTRP